MLSGQRDGSVRQLLRKHLSVASRTGGGGETVHEDDVFQFDPFDGGGLGRHIARSSTSACNLLKAPPLAPILLRSSSTQTLAFNAPHSAIPIDGHNNSITGLTKPNNRPNIHETNPTIQPGNAFILDKETTKPLNVTAKQINALILEHSEQTRLIVLNMPLTGATDSLEFVEYVELLTKDIETCILIRGGGGELISSYS